MRNIFRNLSKSMREKTVRTNRKDVLFKPTKFIAKFELWAPALVPDKQTNKQTDDKKPYTAELIRPRGRTQRKGVGGCATPAGSQKSTFRVLKVSVARSMSIVHTDVYRYRPRG